MMTATQWNRGLSVLVAVGYLVAAGLQEDVLASMLRVLQFLILPMACIWFGEVLGSFTGMMQGRYIDQTTPGWFVSFGGWLLLVGVPLIVFFCSR